MKTILVATDFSDAAAHAAGYAAEMALTINAELFLLHIYQPPVSYGDVPLVLPEKDIEQDAQNLLNKLKNELNEKSNNKLNIASEVIIGSFFLELKQVCQRIQPYAVVMGSQGTSALEHLIFGRHTIYTMKHLTYPVIAVPVDCHYSSIKKIGLACDYDMAAETMPIQEITSYIRDFKAELHIVNTGKKREFSPEAIFGSTQLKEMLKHVQPQFHFITHSDTDEGIIDFAEKRHIDLLIVLPKRHSLFELLSQKSHTKQFVLHSHVPVMALH